MNDKNKSVKKLILKIAVSMLLVIYIYLTIDKRQLIDNIKLLDISYAPIIIIFILLNYIISSYRWKQLLLDKNSSKVSWDYLTGLYFIGSFFNNFMPTSIGGDVYKIFKLGKKINNNTVAFTSTFMERFTGVIILALLSVISFAGVLKHLTVFLLVWFVVSIWLGLIILKYLSKKIKMLRKIYDSLMEYRNYKIVLVYAFALSLVVQLMSVLTQYTIFSALGVNISFMYALFSFPVITLATFFIPSLNGIGVQDALYMQFFLLIGIPIEISLAASVLYHIFRLGVSLIGGLLYAAGKAD